MNNNNPYAKYMSPHTSFKQVPSYDSNSNNNSMNMGNQNQQAQQHQENQECLICQTCEQPYNETNRQPRIMPSSGISYCLDCLQQAFQRVQMRRQGDQSQYNDNIEYFISERCTIQCPENEAELDPSITHVDQLRKNFTMIQRIMNDKQMNNSADVKHNHMQDSKSSNAMAMQNLMKTALVSQVQFQEQLQSKKSQGSIMQHLMGKDTSFNQNIQLRVNQNQNQQPNQGFNMQNAGIPKLKKQNSGSQKQRLDHFQEIYKMNKGNHGQNNEAFQMQNQMEQNQPMNMPIDQSNLCDKHSKAKELVCVTCKKLICHSCALFGEHKGHDVREKDEALKEVVVRTEVLMEMFEQMDQDCVKMQKDNSFQRFKDKMISQQDKLKKQASTKFTEWKEILTLMEKEVHNTIDERFKKYEENFIQEEKNQSKCEEDNRMIQFKIGDLLNIYMSNIEQNPNYIAYDILDSNPENEFAVEKLYQQIEQWTDESKRVIQFGKLVSQESEYEKIYCWFDKNFEDRILNLTQVVDSETPLVINQKPPRMAQNSPQPDNSNLNISGSENTPQMKSKFTSFKKTLPQKGRPSSQMSHGNGSFDMKQKDDFNEIQYDRSPQNIDRQGKNFFEEQQSLQIPINEKAEKCISVHNVESQRTSEMEMSTKGEKVDLNTSTASVNKDVLNDVIQEQIAAALKAQKEVQENSNQAEIMKNLQQFLMQSMNKQPPASTEIDQTFEPLEEPQATVDPKKAQNDMGKLFGVKKTSIGGGSSNSRQNEQTQEVDLDAKPPAGVSSQKKSIKGGKAKEKFIMADSFKQQALMGDIDLSGRNISDQQSVQICQLLKSHGKGVDSIDLSNNKIGDNGMIEICKALNDTKIIRFVISGNKITDNSSVNISGILMRNKNLKTLNMQDCMIKSQVAKNKLVNSLKKIDVAI